MSTTVLAAVAAVVQVAAQNPGPLPSYAGDAGLEWVAWELPTLERDAIGAAGKLMPAVQLRDLALHAPIPQGASRGASAGDVLGGFLVGTGLGVVLGAAMGVVGWHVAKSGEQEDVAGLAGIAIAGGIGYTFGSAVGVRWFENRTHGPRGLQGPLLGSLLGLVLGGGVALAALACGDRDCAAIAVPVAFALPPIGALVGYFRSAKDSGP